MLHYWVMTELNIPSPCVSSCGIDTTTGLCQGCYRTADEIAVWGRLNNEVKMQVVKQLHIRRNKINGTHIRTSKRNRR